MQNDEQKQFSFNARVIFILGLTFLALALPVTLGVYALQMTFAGPSSSPPPPSEAQVKAATAPLRQKVAMIADKTLAAAPFALGVRINLELSAADPDAKAAQLEKLARKLDAMVLPKEAKKGARRLLVSVDREKAPVFLRACQGDHPSQGVVALPGKDARLWVEVLIQKETSP